MPTTRSRRPVFLVVLVMVVANVALLLGLGGAAGSLAQHERVLDDDTLDSCLAALLGDRWSWQYAAGEPVFDGPNTVAADFRRTVSSPAGADAPSVTSGRMRCTVSAGEEIDDPLHVVRVVGVP